MSGGLEVDVSGGDAVVVSATGEIDLLTAAGLGRVLRDLIARRRPSAIGIDLSGVSFIDSTGIQVLVATRIDARAAGIPLRVVAASAPALRVLRLAGVDGALGTSTMDS
jgi:anti-anti-sigma factor